MAVTVNEAGRTGGLKVLERHGRDFFVRIGKRGQAVMRAKYPNMSSKWGRLGGRPRKSSLQHMREDKQIHYERRTRTRPQKACPPLQVYQ
jgi:hypothetical protein